jgi:hypothetical protein
LDFSSAGSSAITPVGSGFVRRVRRRFGLLLVAAPELVPILRALGSAVARGWRRVLALLQKAERAFRRLIRRPRPHVVSGTASMGIAAAGGARGRTSPPEDATLEQKIDYLLRRHQDLQDMIETMSGSLAALPSRWRADIAEESATLRNEHTQALAVMRARHLGARLLGVGLLLVGIVLATVGNLA